jgi:hypothetical protein
MTAVSVEYFNVVRWYPPRLVSFEEALAFVRDARARDGVTLIALDQPTVVRNATSMRPVERVTASLISWLGGGVQPSNTGRVGMFCAASPIWGFLAALGALEDPEKSRTASSGLYLIEVFPALALASLHPSFFGRPRRRATTRDDERRLPWPIGLAWPAPRRPGPTGLAASRWRHGAALWERWTGRQRLNKISLMPLCAR